MSSPGWSLERTDIPVCLERVLRMSSLAYYVTINSSKLDYVYIINIRLDALYILRKFTFIIHMKTFKQISLANVS